MKKTISKKVFATILAAVCAVSAASAVSAVCIANAYSAHNVSASVTLDSAVIIEKTSGSTFVLPMEGEDWNYYADSLNVKVSCDFDYNCSLCKFKFTAVKPGQTNVVLKTQLEGGNWANTPVRIIVDSDLRMNIVQTGNTYLTEKSYSKPAASTTSSSSQKTTEQQAPAAQAGTASYTLQGTDWTYYIDSLNVKVSCDFDDNQSLCNFRFTAVKPGTTNAVLKTQRADGRWNNTPIRATVNSDMTVTLQQTGDTYVTAHSYTE